ncbi:MAG: hypothetical protein LBN93_07810 [Candidatus Symbiothrix sp.]|jgi:hypothetical protein|nr:hypothetical protein [Candidatus Symbiothrix sp.]
MTEAEKFELYKKYKNGGKILIHPLVDKNKSDYKAILNVAKESAKDGQIVKLTPVVHFKSDAYKEIYKALAGTKYDWKCPDMQIGDLFYEYEGFMPPFRTKKLRRMLSHGARQSSRVIINNNKGASETYLRRYIHTRLVQTADLDEVWAYEKGKLRQVFKKQQGD